MVYNFFFSCNLGRFYFHSLVANAVFLHIRTDSVSVGTHRILPQSARSVHSILFLSELSPSQQGVLTKPTEQRDLFGTDSGALCENQSVNEALWQFWYVLSCVTAIHRITEPRNARDEKDPKAHLPTGVFLTAALHQVLQAHSKATQGTKSFHFPSFLSKFSHSVHTNLTQTSPRFRLLSNHTIIHVH